MVNSNKTVKIIESAVLNLCMFTLFSIDWGGGCSFFVCFFVSNVLLFFLFFCSSKRTVSWQHLPFENDVVTGVIVIDTLPHIRTLYQTMYN